jgi:tartrate dehydratase beta subunit/fumarate hydratase class I family protein
MDSYVDLFMQHGGSFITLAKGNRSPQVAEACKKHGGFYLGSIGGPAAVLALESIKNPADRMAVTASGLINVQAMVFLGLRVRGRRLAGR